MNWDEQGNNLLGKGTNITLASSDGIAKFKERHWEGNVHEIKVVFTAASPNRTLALLLDGTRLDTTISVLHGPVYAATSVCAHVGHSETATSLTAGATGKVVVSLRDRYGNAITDASLSLLAQADRDYDGIIGTAEAAAVFGARQAAAIMKRIDGLTGDQQLDRAELDELLAGGKCAAGLANADILEKIKSNRFLKAYP